MNINKECTKSQMQTCERGRSMRKWRKGFLSGLTIVMAIMPMALVLAASNVTGIDHASTGDGGVEIALRTDGDTPQVSVFATENPARIVLDLADTENRAGSESVFVGMGPVQQYSAMGAGGRTRLVVDLSQSSAYDYRVEDGHVFLTISGDGSMASASAPADMSQASHGGYN
ncbi:AMIN domain-containing protein, partial [Pseudomonadota bacterium]